MPIYEFICEECGASFERYQQSWNEAVSCPACHSESVRKQISAFSISSRAATPTVAAGCNCGAGGCGCRS